MTPNRRLVATSPACIQLHTPLFPARVRSLTSSTAQSTNQSALSTNTPAGGGGTDGAIPSDANFGLCATCNFVRRIRPTRSRAVEHGGGGVGGMGGGGLF